MFIETESWLRQWDVARLSSRSYLISVAVAAGLFLSAVSQSIWALDVNQADHLVQQWLDIERQTSRLDSEWLEQEPLLQQRIELLKVQRNQLEALLEKSQSSHSEVKSQRTKLLAEQENMETRQTELQTAIKRLQKVLSGFAGQLPPRVQATWQAEADAVVEKADTSVQLQVLLAQLTNLLEFDQHITIDEMSITTQQGDSILVQQLYLGVGNAWFSSADGSIAGTGQPEADGWNWKIDKSIEGDAVLLAINMFKREQEAALIQLPLQLKREQP